jgi:hypothetical protein
MLWEWLRFDGNQIYFCSFVVSELLPCQYFVSDDSDILDSSVETLASEDVQLDFGHIQPAPMFRGVNKFETIP